MRPPDPPPDESPAALRALADELVALGLKHGLAAIGIASAAPLEQARQALEERKAAGLHGGMGFTYRNPSRSTDPGRLLRGARSVVVAARSYLADEPAAPPGPVGRVARYARRDHYADLRGALGAIAGRLREARWRAVVHADDNALVDRAIAERAGLGWFGKNANLLLPGRGSWFVLGAVVTSAPLPAAEVPVGDGCGSCRRCLDGCPTGAIVAPGVVDARRCLAWLVQAPGPIPRAYRTVLGDRIYGCDDCQEVCPPNLARIRHQPVPAETGDAWVPLLEVLGASDHDLLTRYGRWYLWQRDPVHLRRNALVALGNVGNGRDPAVVAALCCALTHPAPLVRAHAVWAAARLGRHDLLRAVAGDRDPMVRAELLAESVEPLTGGPDGR